MNEIRPVGTALPPYPDSLIQAADVSHVSAAETIDVEHAKKHLDFVTSPYKLPRSQDRMLEYFDRDQVPAHVRTTLASAWSGDLAHQQLLFTAILDTWPKAQKNINEIARLVSIAPWKVHAFARRGEKPKAGAEKLAKEVENLMWTMKPDVTRRENGFEGTIKSLAMGYYFGHSVSEIRWQRQKDGSLKPRATKPLMARYYGYPTGWATDSDPEDRLMLDRDGGLGARKFEDFPEHRFLIGINSGHPGHPATAAPLRALVPYWMAAVYGLKWFMDFTQIYGIPWRHVEVADERDNNAVDQAMATIGSRGFLRTKPGVKVNILAQGTTSGQNLPQRELIALADRQCDTFILGQTLTSGTAENGNRALGDVHENTKNAMVDAVADFVGEVLTHQLAPAIVTLNWGERDDVPEIWAKREESKDEKAKAERMEILTRIGVPIAKAWVYEDLGVPMPAPEEELFQATPDGAQGDPATGATLPHETKEDLEDPDEEKPQVKAADASLTWRRFPANSGTLGIPRSEMPQIASGNRGALVGFLRARGIESKTETVSAESLKPTQAEFAPEKVDAAANYSGGNRAILISQDNHVVDGHHQWLAALKQAEPIKVIRLQAPITRILMMVHRMPSTTVAASIREDYADSQPLAVDQLSEAVLEGLTGVTKNWLSPVRPAFDRLAALAMSNQVTDEDFVAALEKAQSELPELFDLLDTESLQTAFENAISSAALAGTVHRQSA